jgi:hypothetical protein
MGSQTAVEKCGKGDQYVRFISIVETDQGRWPTLQSGLEFPEIDRYQDSRHLHLVQLVARSPNAVKQTFRTLSAIIGWLFTPRLIVDFP